MTASAGTGQVARGRLPRLVLSLCLLLLVLTGLPGQAPADGPVDGSVDGPVVEILRLKVPAAARRAWRQAEAESWGPWLQRQVGFQGRELLWDAEQEEGLLLIRWRSRREWLAIPAAELEVVQERFETAARRALGPTAAGPEADVAVNPFPLVAAGALEPMGHTPAPGPGEGG